MLVASSSPVKFSEIVFPVWNFEQSLKFVPQKQFLSRCESLEIELFHRELSRRTRANSLSEFHTNSLKYTATIEEVILTAIDYFECGERNTELCAITAPSYKQANKLSQLQKTELNLLTVTFLAILK